jgi:hypothetical protein
MKILAIALSLDILESGFDPPPHPHPGLKWNGFLLSPSASSGGWTQTRDFAMVGHVLCHIVAASVWQFSLDSIYTEG